MKTYELNCLSQTIKLTFPKEESIKDGMMREYGWLIKPMMGECNTFENVLERLNWKVQMK